MKKVVRFSLSSLSVLLATGLLARWWLTNPDAIPRFPASFWVWLGNIYGVQNGEEFADLETFVALGLSFVVVLLVTSLGGLLWCRMTKR